MDPAAAHVAPQRPRRVEAAGAVLILGTVGEPGKGGKEPPPDPAAAAGQVRGLPEQLGKTALSPMYPAPFL